MAKNKNLFRVLLISIFLLCNSFNSNPVRIKIKNIYDHEVGVREKTGRNDGVMVETYLRYCALSKGNPWCASFVCWSFGRAGIPNPKSGYCPDLFTTSHVIYKRSSKSPNKTPQQGDVWGLYFPEKGRVAHVGFVDDWQDKYVITVEGNTNEKGSREGDGVYRKRRLIKSIYIVANYIDK
ncbi:MAG TPA: CHAP domain-containing protein [Mucilaginibacter sp.]